jgi:hypothetical protein
MRTRGLAVTVDAGDEHCKAAAYHESAHIVVACLLGLPISPNGIYINNFAEGRAWFKGATDGVALPSTEVHQVVIALLAGGVAHRRVHRNLQDACKGDDWRIKEILESHFPDSETRREMEHQFQAQALEFVDAHWEVIARVAEALWGKSWRPKYQHRHWPKEKALSASELVTLIDHVPVLIDEYLE